MAKRNNNFNANADARQQNMTAQAAGTTAGTAAGANAAGVNAAGFNDVEFGSETNAQAVRQKNQQSQMKAANNAAQQNATK
ncbi:hypothetical protein [Aneurinibacillus terranovensis]|uniref:hypothetical protein n=1 Tax=Aneurinibacillus terranovensis TaxID=278991 RepID=UPI000417141D|nr:hypothetical protein [Aneurinibacillus terranovensis]